MTGAVEMQEWIKKYAPKHITVLRINSQELLIEYDFKKQGSFDQSCDGWWNGVRNEGYVINGMSWWEDMKFRMDLVRRFQRR